MSKHALSRIYEHYISILRDGNSPQRSLFPPTPDEYQNRERGGIYTPQYIARFFARFLKESHTPPRFRGLRTIDPACGSGMFLRTLLEMQCDPLERARITNSAPGAFRGIMGIDIESNACKATRLSLTLLHLVLTGVFPPHPLEILEAETLEYVAEHQELDGDFDAVIANPPYVKWEHIGSELQPRVSKLLEEYDAARPDLYLAFVKIGIRLIKPGGYILYVLPHAFLLAKNAAKLRTEIADQCWIRFLVDLSDVQVFEEVNSYPILLIAQKRPLNADSPVDATIVRCAGFAGHALQDALDGQHGESKFYSVYTTTQDTFREASWRVLPPIDNAIKQRISRFSELSQFVRIAQGLNTGMDKVFVRDRLEVPPDEEGIFAPLLQDREMERFRVPAFTSSLVFYPYGPDETILGGGRDPRAAFR